MLKGAIFDFDGTLLDSMHIWDNIGTSFLSSINIEAEENLNAKLKTMSIAESISYLKTAYNLNQTTDEIDRYIKDMVKKHYLNDLGLKPGVIEYLTYLKNNNVKMAIASACDKKLLIAALKRLEIFSFFDSILTCDDVSSGKESPLLFNTSLKELKTKRDETYIYEDALYAIKTAKNAGFTVVVVEDQYNKEDRDEIKILADYYIKDFTSCILVNQISV